MSGTKQRGFFKGVFAKSTPLLAVALWVPNVLLGPISLGNFVSLAVTPDSSETPFAKTPFSWVLKMVCFVADDVGFSGPGIPDLVTELCPPQDTAYMLRKVTEKKA